MTWLLKFLRPRPKLIEKPDRSHDKQLEKLFQSCARLSIESKDQALRISICERMIQQQQGQIQALPKPVQAGPKPVTDAEVVRAMNTQLLIP